MSLPHDNDLLIRRILSEIRRERYAQDAKFGNQTVKGIPKWHSILAEEYGEVAKEICEILHGGGSRENFRVELIQTAAVAAAFVQYGDLNGWWPEERDEADDGTFLSKNPTGDVQYPTCPVCRDAQCWVKNSVRLCWRCKPHDIPMIVPEGMAAK